ncbi:TrmH family RNA methyltransferase [Niabella drilacis]|uniref:tRNA (guanosine(18)-2'-O)-methyltransferase n=1 Tax=Niabella drilacis (strain DSM 25811 / CCM 8410 / CCUG 62505 / LMG 26954 / E90) TaxID=1285928 RepID=A0A1G6YAS2_NIADE|nr:RNA methyltransferase [Niabella drilacis]SDD87584.1 tRNA (guanosine-2'-O-)-methyltransferase [Niabella drilacis]
MTNERREKLEKVISKRQPGLGIVLENVFDPHNISAVMRSCDAVGIQDVYILNTKIPRHKKWGAKSSSGAAKWLSVHEFDRTEECFAVLKNRYDKICTTHLSSDAVSLYEMDLVQNIALVFGNEHGGVSDEVRELANGNFIIPQVGIIQSLNISVACAVSIYEAFRQRSIAGLYNAPPGSEYHQQLRTEWGIGEI